MEKVRFGLVGCGGMGTRHLHGLRELAQTPFGNVELVAVCDLRPQHAELAAAEAERLLGRRPAVYTDLEAMRHGEPDLAAVDVVTDPSTHHTVVCQALELGLHVVVEKPMAITVRACRQMLEMARRKGLLLSVAENFRRDPSARLVHHLVGQGAIGAPYMGLFHSVSPGNTIFITPWRHHKERGGALLDMGVHFTHMIRYQLGQIAEVHASARIVEPVRVKPKQAVWSYEFYRAQYQEMVEEVQATAEDTSLAMFRMASGATVSWMVGLGGHGSCHRELILGDRGSIEGFGTRGGRVSLQRVGQEEVSQEALLAQTPDFALDPLTAHLFPTGVTAGDSAVDLKLIAFELHELAAAISDKGRVEVDAEWGLKDVAALYAIFESSVAGRPVSMAEVESGEVCAYQAEIDAALGIA
ncbi:MAG: Gfo/Idh/MocA family oxidoreductase [Candidatus Latescibacteria bacterium]|nr:Gfo/Idh/MocA family oxidoreductase [Candidatus Latescibacterota bacterium]